MNPRLANKCQGTCIIRIQEILSPYHHTSRGFRIQVAIPNVAGHKAFSTRLTVAFTKRYLLLQSSDILKEEEAEEKLNQAKNWLRRRGFHTIYSTEEYLEKCGL